MLISKMVPYLIFILMLKSIKLVANMALISQNVQFSVDLPILTIVAKAFADKLNSMINSFCA